jgi:hypothetical protein
VTNDHADLEAFLGEDAGYFPAASTSEIPSAGIVDAWYTGPVAATMALYGVSDAVIEDSLADDWYRYWLWRHASPAGTTERANSAETLRWSEVPYVPSPRTMRLIKLSRGDINFN